MVLTANENGVTPSGRSNITARGGRALDSVTRAMAVATAQPDTSGGNSAMMKSASARTEGSSNRREGINRVAW